VQIVEDREKGEAEAPPPVHGAHYDSFLTGNALVISLKHLKTLIRRACKLFGGWENLKGVSGQSPREKRKSRQPMGIKTPPRQDEEKGCSLAYRTGHMNQTARQKNPSGKKTQGLCEGGGGNARSTSAPVCISRNFFTSGECSSSLKG